MFQIILEEKINHLKEKLNLAVIDTELTSEEIVDLSQQLDKLIVLECRERLEK